MSPTLTHAVDLSTTTMYQTSHSVFLIGKVMECTMVKWKMDLFTALVQQRRTNTFAIVVQMANVSTVMEWFPCTTSEADCTLWWPVHHGPEPITTLPEMMRNIITICPMAHHARPPTKPTSHVSSFTLPDSTLIVFYFTEVTTNVPCLMRRSLAPHVHNLWHTTSLIVPWHPRVVLSRKPLNLSLTPQMRQRRCIRRKSNNSHWRQTERSMKT